MSDWYQEMMQSVEARDAFYRFWRGEFGRDVTDDDGAYEMGMYMRGRYDERHIARGPNSPREPSTGEYERQCVVADHCYCYVEVDHLLAEVEDLRAQLTTGVDHA